MTILECSEAVQIFKEAVRVEKAAIKLKMGSMSNDYGNISRKIMNEIEEGVLKCKSTIKVKIKKDDFLEKIESMSTADTVLRLIERDLKVLGFNARFNSTLCVYSGYNAFFTISLQE